MKKQGYVLLVAGILLSSLLISCGQPKYLGQWYFGKESATKTIESMIPALLNEANISDSNSADAKAIRGALEYELMDYEVDQYF